MRKKILIYKEYPAECGVITLSLTENFNFKGMDIRFIGLDDILHEKLGGPDTILVFPGAPDGDGYRSQLGGKGFDIIRRHVEKGGALLSICAFTYLSSKSYSYLEDDGTLKHYDSDFPLLNAHAHGPLLELSDPDKRWGGRWARHDVALLDFEDENGKIREAGVCYSKGPKLFIDPGEKCQIIARFKALAGKPAAIVGKQIGEGYAVFCSVSLDVSGSQMKDKIRPVDDHLVNAKIYVEELARVEQSRHELWNLVWRKLIVREPALT